jgi:hypothetical protein
MRTLRPAALAAVLLLAAQACGTSTSGAPTSTPSTDGTGIQVSLTLSQTTVRAGTPIKATLVIDNRTGGTVKAGCGVRYDVGIGSAQIPFRPLIATYCAANQSVANGRTTVPVTIITTYQGCSETGQADGPMPGCLPGPMSSGSRFTNPPPLPKGTYQTAVVVIGPPANLLHLPAAITVTLD